MTKCCFNSVDENNYSRISITIPPLSGCRYTAIRCDSFTCNCNIRVLNKDDYIRITMKKMIDDELRDYTFVITFEDYTKLDAETFAELLNEKLHETYDITCGVDNCNRIYFESDKLFWFNEISYNLKLLLGVYSWKDEDIKAGKLKAVSDGNGRYKLQMKSVGMYLSTPVLNLVSNIGDASFRNNSDDIVNIQSCNTVLRINNSFSPNIPIIASGDGSTSIIPSGYVSGAVFILVDANMKQVDLLNPMYITLTMEPLSGYEN